MIEMLNIDLEYIAESRAQIFKFSSISSSYFYSIFKFSFSLWYTLMMASSKFLPDIFSIILYSTFYHGVKKPSINTFPNS